MCFLAVNEAVVEPEGEEGEEKPEEEKVWGGEDGLDWGSGINKFGYWQDMEAVGHHQDGGQNWEADVFTKAGEKTIIVLCRHQLGE